MAVTLLIGCGGQQTTASRSAAAFDEAQQKGQPVAQREAHGAHPHGTEPEAAASPAAHEHGPAPPAEATPEHGHAVHPAHGAARPASTGAHAARGHEPPPRAAGGPAGHAGGHGSAALTSESGHEGMTHGSPHGAPGHAAMGHETPAASTHTQMDHSALGHGAPPPRPPRESATAAPGDAAAGLAPDSLDRPAATALQEVQRAREMSGAMAGHAHGGTYRQVDAGRVPDEKASGHAPPAPAAGHHGHGGHSLPAPSPSPPREPERRP